MYCVRKVSEDLWWVGGNDRRLAMFEGVYSVPNGVSYNSYLLMDDFTVLFDTVDPAGSKVFFENIDHVLGGRELNFLVVQHMEPDHSGTIDELLLRHPETVIVCGERVRTMLSQFRTDAVKNSFYLVKEGSVFNTGHHELTFLSAPMVHWPEVMVTYDITTKTLFSADAFGTFGAINGALFADEVDFMRDYLDEARRYYCNIVGKYGTQVQALLKKAATVEIERICPLHGFVWRRDIGEFLEKYQKWSTYTPEETGVMIAYASVYGNTANAAELLSVRLRERGVKTVMFDVSVTPASEIIAAAFRWSHLVFASTTYNAGIFVSMDELLHDLAAHNLQNRTVALIENGSWAPTAGGLMRKILSGLKNVTVLDEALTIRSALQTEQVPQIDAVHLAEGIVPALMAGPRVVEERGIGRVARHDEFTRAARNQIFLHVEPFVRLLEDLRLVRLHPLVFPERIFHARRRGMRRGQTAEHHPRVHAGDRQSVRLTRAEFRTRALIHIAHRAAERVRMFIDEHHALHL